jgi:hypothetical protein
VSERSFLWLARTKTPYYLTFVCSGPFWAKTSKFQLRRRLSQTLSSLVIFLRVAPAGRYECFSPRSYHWDLSRCGFSLYSVPITYLTLWTLLFYFSALNARPPCRFLGLFWFEMTVCTLNFNWLSHIHSYKWVQSRWFRTKLALVILVSLVCEYMLPRILGYVFDMWPLLVSS